MAVTLYVTCKDRQQAMDIANTMVAERLVACANLLGPISSVYWWDGKVQQGDEFALLLKTRDQLVEPATNRIKQLHSYDVPCVVAYPITGGNLDFLNWITAETKQ